ncbi:hypothetical protein J6590_105584, partial [Homalodisca vitripennis]
MPIRSALHKPAVAGWPKWTMVLENIFNALRVGGVRLSRTTMYKPPRVSCIALRSLFHALFLSKWLLTQEHIRERSAAAVASDMRAMP